MQQPLLFQTQQQQAQQQMFQQGNLSRQNTVTESIIHSPPATSHNSHLFGPDQVIAIAPTTLHTTPSVRTFMTQATTRQGHAHTSSDVSLLDANLATSRYHQQPVAEATPYVISDASSSSGGYGNARKYNGGLRYTPPPPPTPVLPVDNYELPTVSQTGPSVAGETYHGIMGSTMGVGNEIDRAATMSPAEASSVVDAAPPYVIQDEERNRYPNTRHTPRLPNVDEYPEEKSRFTG
ncbi:hypothetical protein FRC17_009465 [Serendipita sp. 399]|nr:hypothetical protein FRC17_009465 [Serendipita sp. 399]